MRKVILIILTLLCGIVMSAKDIFVDANVVIATNDGTTWATAHPDLQLALAEAVAGDKYILLQVHIPLTLQIEQ